MTELCFPLRRSSLLEFCKHLSEDEDRLVQMYTDTVYQEGKNYLDQEIFPQLTDVTGGEMLQKVIQFFGLDTWCGYRLTRVEYDAHANPPHMDLILWENQWSVLKEHTLKIKWLVYCWKSVVWRMSMVSGNISCSVIITCATIHIDMINPT